MEAMPGFEPGIKALQASALPLGYIAVRCVDVGRISKNESRIRCVSPSGPGHRRVIYGADDRIRTGDPNLGKVVLYQLSHVRTRQSARGRIAKPPQPRKRDFGPRAPRHDEGWRAPREVGTIPNAALGADMGA
jgi:hypothetical protein